MVDGHRRAGLSPVHWSAMDKVKFGRALGYGARHAAKAALQAVDAATTSDKAAPASSETGTGAGRSAASSARAQRQSAPVGEVISPAQTRSQTTTQSRAQASAAERIEQAQHTARHSTRQAKALGRSVWSPLARVSGVLWLEVTGSIYAVIALGIGQAAFLRRADLRLGISDPAAERAWLMVVIFSLFAYFAVSSFVRAHRRSRK